MTRSVATLKAGAMGILATAGLLAAYFLIVTVVSDWALAFDQFLSFWYFILSLAIGFGVQIGLYTYLRGAIHSHHASGKVVAVSGTTSTVAMVSCYAHYLANILPVIGAAGLITLVGQYQVELFWVGLAANASGIVYIGTKVIRFSRVNPAIVSE